jgi:hypothetical protein
MKTDKTLEEKLNDAESNLPGVRDQLKPHNFGSWGTYWKGAPEDVEYIETDRYQIVAAKWERHSWSEYGGGVEWTEWVSVHYREKGSEGKIPKLETEQIVTRDGENSRKDRNDLWPYNFVSVESTGPTQIEVAWADQEGNKGPTYKLDLEKKPDSEKKEE